MPILFFVNCERTVLSSVKRDLDTPPPPVQPSVVRAGLQPGTSRFPVMRPNHLATAASMMEFKPL